MRRLELKIPPLVLSGLSALAIVAAGLLWPLQAAPMPGQRALALGLLLLGLGVMFGGAWQFRRRRTTLDPRDPSRARHIVSDGLYRITRNPMYLGMALALAGLAVGWPSVVGVLLVPGFVLYLTELQIKPEERALLALFGDDYRAYLGRVRRWL